MNGIEVLRIVDAIHRDKNIDKEIVFEGIEQAILSAARKHFGEEEELLVEINRETGEPGLTREGELFDPELLGDLLGRVPAQTAKQVMIQKIREAERDSLFEEYSEFKSQMVTGVVTRMDGGAATVNLGKVEGILPRGEQIPGEAHRVGERVRAVIIEVRKAGSRVKIILSRTHADLVRRLFELEIPEVGEHVIEVRSLAREAGYRSKVAVSSYDSKVDCVGACVGVRGSRIKSVVDELAGERVDIVRWNDSLQVLVPNALQPAEVEDVILCPMLGKVIVLVHEEQLSLGIGKKGQNVRLASKLVGWDIHIMTQEKLDVQLDKSVADFSSVPEVSEELAESLVAQGFFTYDDLSVIEPDQLAELGGLTTEQCDTIVAYADVESLRVEEEERKAFAEARQARREAAEAAREAEKLAAAAPPEPEVAETSEVNAEAGDGEATTTIDEEAPAATETAAETEQVSSEDAAEPDASPEEATTQEQTSAPETSTDAADAASGEGPEAASDVESEPAGDDAPLEPASDGTTAATPKLESATTETSAADDAVGESPEEATDSVDPAEPSDPGDSGQTASEHQDESLSKAEASAGDD